MRKSIFVVELKKGTRQELFEPCRLYIGSNRKSAFKYLYQFAEGFDVDLTKVPDDVAIWVDVAEIYWDENNYSHKQIIDQLIIKEAYDES